jgi:hypothetical protein
MFEHRAPGRRPADGKHASSSGASGSHDAVSSPVARRAPALEKLEEGGIFFFYRPRVGSTEVHGRQDVQRHLVVLAAERPSKIYRLLVVGRKKLPELTEGQHPERRNWAFVDRVTSDPLDIHRELVAVAYETKTRGMRFLPAAKPVGEGRYQIVRHGKHTELAYALELPRRPGPAQHAFGILKQASYIIAIRNPEAGSPAGVPSAPRPPEYPRQLRERFGDRRWSAADPELLDHEDAELVLIAAHAEDLDDALGLHIDARGEELASARVFRELHLRFDREQVAPLLTGEFPAREESADQAHEIRHLSPDEAPTKAGHLGGRAAARRAPSAFALTHLLGGIDFPRRRDGLVDHAVQHADRVDNPGAAVEVLLRLPDRTYENMAEVMSAVGEVVNAGAPYVCLHDGEIFDQRSRFERHMAAAHPPPAVNAADIMKALAGIELPKGKQELVDHASRALPADSDVLRAIRALPERTYHSAADIATGFGDSKRGGGSQS